MQKIYVVDASGFIFRSYHAIRPMTGPKGQSTNALFGFIRSLLKLFKDFNPEYMAIVFDGVNNSESREAIYAEYKANRAECPKDLAEQLVAASRFCEIAGLKQIMWPGVEADDTMGALAKWGPSSGFDVFLCTSDKDMCQMVSSHVFILNTFKENLILDPKGVEANFGVPPSQIVDLLSLSGDGSDNVPGVSGFGLKTAAALLKEYGSLEALLDNAGKVPGKKGQTLLEQKDKAVLSKKLVQLQTDIPIPHAKEEYLVRPPELQELKDFFSEFGFHSLSKELEEGKIALPLREKVIKVEERLTYQLINDEKSFIELLCRLKEQKEICFDTETTSIRPLEAELVGIGFGYEPGIAYYVPFNGNLDSDWLLAQLKPIFESDSTCFYGHNVKYDYHVLQNYGITVTHIAFDTLIASYTLNAEKRRHNLDELALDYFGKVKIPISDLIGKGKSEISMKDVAVEAVCRYCAEDVDYTVRLKHILENELQERGLVSLFEIIELPLLRVLANMERRGIFVDKGQLTELSEEFTEKIGRLEYQIYAMAGEKFNLKSPKQLSQILFEKLKIAPQKKTTTGFSTNADVLESLADEYPIVEKIMEFRQLEKLRSTYVDTLPAEINPKTGRIHCTFNQSVAATGRLASQNPNLQNIPVRSEEGKRIREAFIPEKQGWSFLSADYSQMELRVLAHLCRDPRLVEAFEKGEDIHAATAAQIFSVPSQEVTPFQRHLAKAVNFGIIYGQQAFGLSKELKVDVKQAAAFIDTYFRMHPNVKNYIESCVASAKKTGKAVTVTGRERQIPEILSKNRIIEQAAERLAVNSPIQGTSADIIKMAMILIEKRIKERKSLRGYMILQIHDELLFETPDEEAEELATLVKEGMETAFPLSVPLTVNITVGKNWKEC